MEIKQQNSEIRGVFEAFIDGRSAGKMTYTWAGEDRLIIDHTGVEEAYNGQGVGMKLLEAVVDFARKNHKTIIPLCPFAKAMFQKHQELQDVLA